MTDLDTYTGFGIDEEAPVTDATTSLPEPVEGSGPDVSTAEPDVRGVHTLSMAKAINAGLRDALAADEKVLLMGEDIGKLGGVFRVTEGGCRPSSERSACSTRRSPSRASSARRSASRCAGIARSSRSSSTGSSSPAFDQITTQLARQTLRHEGRVSMPIVIRVPYGGHIVDRAPSGEPPRRTSRTRRACGS